MADRFVVKRVGKWIEVYLPREKDKRKKWTYALGFVDKDGTLIITDVYVRPSLRGKGIGRALVNRLMDESGCSEVMANNIQPKARGFWERKEIEEVIDGRTWPRVERERERYLVQEGYI